MPPIFFKTLKALLLIFLLVCLPSDSSGDTTNSPREIHLWHQWTGSRREILESIIKDFNCSHADVRAHAELFGPAGGTIAERMPAGTASTETQGLPDIALVERQAIPLLADSDAIASLDEFIESSATLKKESFFDNAFAYGAFNGKLYGIPVTLNPFVLIYNPNLLSEYGLSEPPEEWDALAGLAKAVNAHMTDHPGDRQRVLSVRSMAILFDILCLQKGIDLCALNSNPENIAAIRDNLGFARELRRNGSLPPAQYKFWDPNFMGIAGGDVLFQIDDAAMLADLTEETSFPLSVGPVPDSASMRQTLLSESAVFVVSKTVSDYSAILEFLEFFYLPRQYARFARELLFVPPLTQTLPAVEVMLSDRPLYGQLAGAAVRAGSFPLRKESGRALSEIARAIERLDAGLISEEQAIADIQNADEHKSKVESKVSGPRIRVTWAESTRRLRATDAGGPKDFPIEIACARNEHETFQLALSADSAVDGLTVTLAPFTSSDGRSCEIKALTYLEEDTLISTPLVAETKGLYPNVLRRRDVFDVVPGTLTRIWVDVFVPREVAPTRYHSRLTIAHEGMDPVEAPVQLDALPMTLPTTPSQPAVVGLNYDLTAKRYDLKEGTDERLRLEDSFYWFLVEHRLSPYQPPVPLDDARIARYLQDERVSSCRIPFPPDDPRFKRVISLAADGGWLEKLFVYFIDEPTYHQYEAIISTGKMIRSFPLSPKFLVTCFPDQFLLGAVDIWCIHMQFLPEGIPRSFVDRQRNFDAVNRRLDAGDKVWWYTAGAVKPFPTLQIEDDPAAFRIIAWLQQLYGIGGFLHWETANWRQPIDEPFIPQFGNGEGVLIYPGDGLQPAPSIRLELLREGMEDMEFLMLLRRNVRAVQEKLAAEKFGDVASGRVREMCRALVSDEVLRAEPFDDLSAQSHFIREPGLIERVRMDVVKEILALEKKPLALVLTQPEEKSYTQALEARIYGIAERGSKVEINGRRLAVSQAGEFSAQFPLSRGANAFRIRLEKGRDIKTVIRYIQRF